MENPEMEGMEQKIASGITTSSVGQSLSDDQVAELTNSILNSINGSPEEETAEGPDQEMAELMKPSASPMDQYDTK